MGLLPCRLQTLRVLQGRPYPDQELTLEVTPLEAGLWHTVSFTKGCYLGQETIAKVSRRGGTDSLVCVACVLYWSLPPPHASGMLRRHH